MGKKPQRHTWGEAKKLCRLNQHDLEMAIKLGFKPDALIRARPDPKQKWKLPVKEWVRDLYFKRYGHVLDEPPLPVVAAPVDIKLTEEEMRRVEEEIYWDDYRDRNSEFLPAKKGKKNTMNPVKTPAS